MAVTIASFREGNPEFTFVPDAQLTAQLAYAESIVSADAFATETRRDLVVTLTLAHALALSPLGRDAGLVDKRGDTTYGAQLRQVCRGNAALLDARMGTLVEYVAEDE